MDAAIVLLGMLIPIAAASVFYLEDRRSTRASVPAPGPARQESPTDVAETATETGTRPELVTVMHADTSTRPHTAPVTDVLASIPTERFLPVPQQEIRTPQPVTEEVPV